jgi:ribosomal-protein-alanine N-acetyltransferase
MNSNKLMETFRLVGCGRDGAPSENLGELSRAIQENCEATAALYRRAGFMVPWIAYLSVLDGTVVGGGAFVGPPKQNRVEIAYFTLSEYQSKGMASRTANLLVRLAKEANPSIELFAKTLPELNASTTILSRLGFRQIGIVADDDIGEAWGWLLTAPAD